MQQLKTMMTAGRWIASSIFIISERRQREDVMYTVPGGIPCRTGYRADPFGKAPAATKHPSGHYSARTAAGHNGSLGASARLRVVSEPKRAACNVQRATLHTTCNNPWCLGTETAALHFNRCVHVGKARSPSPRHVLARAALPSYALAQGHYSCAPRSADDRDAVLGHLVAKHAPRNAVNHSPMRGFALVRT